jgi:hypothetical protein
MLLLGHPVLLSTLFYLEQVVGEGIWINLLLGVGLLVEVEVAIVLLAALEAVRMVWEQVIAVGVVINTAVVAVVAQVAQD